MKKHKVLIITIILTVLAGLWLSTQSYSQVKFPDKSIKFDTATLNTVKERGLDKKSTTELAVKVVQQSDSISVQKDSIVAKEKEITSLKDDLKKNLMGGLSLGTLLSAFIFALIGMFIRWGYKTFKSVKINETTPVKFNVRYWLRDNSHKIFRVLTSLAIVYVFLIFTKQLLGVELTMGIALFIGLFIDVLADKLLALRPPFKVPEVKEEKTV